MKLFTFYVLLQIVCYADKSFAQVHATYYDAGETILKEKIGRAHV